MNEEERNLVEMVLSGRNDAFEPLVTPYRGPLLALAYRLTRNVEDAKEVVQDAMLKAFRHLASYDPSRSFRNWLFQITANGARDLARKKRREHDVIVEAAEAIPQSDDPERGRQASELRTSLTECLSVLTLREREIFILRDLEDMDIKTAARIIGCSNVSVRVNLSSARRKMRDALRNRYPHGEEGR